MNKALASPPRWFFRHPALDVLFIAGLFWPSLLLLQASSGAFQFVHLLLYLAVVTPHRWLTLLLVFLDPDRFEQRPRVYVWMLVGTFLLCFGSVVLGKALGLGLEAFYLLLAVDFLWNTWHFGSQHHGIYRIYGRLGGGGPLPAETLERYALRGFVMYVLFRIPAVTLFADRDFGHWLGWLGRALHDPWPLDLVALLIPVGLMARELVATPRVTSRALYLASVLSIYSAMLLALGCHQRLGWTLDQTPMTALAVGITALHSVEYMGIVSWSTSGKRNPRGSFRAVVEHWPLVLVSMMALVTVLQFAATRLGPEVTLWWICINLAVSLLHYAYDGLIWRAPRPAR